jgi:hypothetical protein
VSPQSRILILLYPPPLSTASTRHTTVIRQLIVKYFFYGERCLQDPCNGCGGGGDVPRNVNVFSSGGGMALPLRCVRRSSSSLPLPRPPHPLGIPTLIDCYFFTIPCDDRGGDAPRNVVGMALTMVLQGL